MFLVISRTGKENDKCHLDRLLRCTAWLCTSIDFHMLMSLTQIKRFVDLSSIENGATRRQNGLRRALFLLSFLVIRDYKLRRVIIPIVTVSWVLGTVSNAAFLDLDNKSLACLVARENVHLPSEKRLTQITSGILRNQRQDCPLTIRCVLAHSFPDCHDAEFFVYIISKDIINLSIVHWTVPVIARVCVNI